MHSFLNNILSDKKGGEIFTCFSLWHWFYILATIAVATGVIITLKDKDQKLKNTRINLFIYHF